MPGKRNSPPSNSPPATDYHELVRTLPYFADAPDSNIDRVGKATCEVLASSEDGWLVAVKVLTEQDPPVPAKPAGSFITYAYSRHCPDQITKVPGRG